MKKLILFFVFLSTCMFGCGSATETTGTLTLSEITVTDLTGGRYNVDAIATFVPVAGKEATGAEINFTAVYSSPSNPNMATKTSKVTLSKTGIATFTGTVDQGSEPVYIRVIASIGGLSQTKVASVPAIKP